MNSNKKVLITGGAGFLGSHLTRALIEQGHTVYILDNFAASARESVSAEAQVFEADIRDAQQVDDVFTSVGSLDAVFHTAALPRVQFSIDNPVESHDTNVNGTLNLLLAAKDHKVGKVIYSASSSAYGDQPVLPLREDMLPNPKSPYALHKYAGEHNCRIFSLVYGLPTVSLRYFNLYGPGADPNGPYAQAIVKFIELRRQGKPITITGTGEQTRDSVHVRDVVRANILAWQSPLADGEVVNIGSGRSASVLEVARLIGGPVEHIPPRVEPMHTRADISRARELLGWEPTITLEEGIAELKREAGLV